MNELINKTHCGDALQMLKTFPDRFVHCCVTSPPYWGLRDYGVAGQIGLEKTPEEYVDKMVKIFREVRRVLRDDGTLWLVLGDSYCSVPSACQNPRSFRRDKNHMGEMDKRAPGYKIKDIIGIPWMVAFALRADGWYLRSDIIWHKPNPMPESAKDRPTKSHEYIFLLSKSQKYYYNYKAIQEEATCGESRPDGIAKDRILDYDSKEKKIRPSKKRGEFKGKWKDVKGKESFRAIRQYRNKRSVWTVTTQPYPEAHFATYPPELIKPCVLAGCPKCGIVIDPFMGSGTTAWVAREYGCNYIGVELNPKSIKLQDKRLSQLVMGI